MSYYDRRTGKLYSFNAAAGRFVPAPATYIDNCAPYETPQFLTPGLLEAMNTNVMAVLRTRPDLLSGVSIDSLGEMRWRITSRANANVYADIGSKGLAGNFNQGGWPEVQDEVRRTLDQIDAQGR